MLVIEWMSKLLLPPTFEPRSSACMTGEFGSTSVDGGVSAQKGQRETGKRSVCSEKRLPETREL